LKNNTRREFLHHFAALGIVCSGKPTYEIDHHHQVADWSSIKAQFLVDEYPVLNLNSGSAGIMSRSVLKKYIEYLSLINSHAPYEILDTWQEQIQHSLHRLSDLIHASKGHLHLLRNSTEALNIVLWGKQWKKKDEIIHAASDYPLMINTLKHLKISKKIKLKTVDHGLLKNISDDEIINNYERKINKKTELLILTYITHREGHIFPVQRICDMAKSYGVEVLIDAAHAIGHIEHNVDDIDCDYYASSLHKWLNAPLGSGVLYIKNEKLPDINPPLSYPINATTQNNKFDYLGTRAYQNGMAIGHALDDLESIGIANKQNRLHHLKKYWTEKIKNESNLEVITDINRSCAIASVRVPMPLNKIAMTLQNDYKIHVKKSGYIGDGFLRISPNIFTLESDLDYFVASLKSACR
jgi:selenocysteine lyase/cysteine desulfurase